MWYDFCKCSDSSSHVCIFPNANKFCLVSLPLWLTQLFFYSTIRLLVSARAVGAAAVSASMRRRLRTRRRWKQNQLVTWQCDDNRSSGNDLKWPQRNEDAQETFAQLYVSIPMELLVSSGDRMEMTEKHFAGAGGLRNRSLSPKKKFSCRLETHRYHFLTERVLAFQYSRCSTDAEYLITPLHISRDGLMPIPISVPIQGLSTLLTLIKYICWYHKTDTSWMWMHDNFA